MAVKGSKNTKQRSAKTKAEMMGENSAQEKTKQSSESETLENLPKTNKQKSAERSSDKPLH